MTLFGAAFLLCVGVIIGLILGISLHAWITEDIKVTQQEEGDEHEHHHC